MDACVLNVKIFISCHISSELSCWLGSVWFVSVWFGVLGSRFEYKNDDDDEPVK